MATEMYLKIAGVDGEAEHEDHKDEIEVLSWSFGASNSSSIGTGGGAGAGKANLSDISFTKWVDKSSPLLFQALCAGEHYDEATLALYKVGGEGGRIKYLEMKFNNTMLTSLSVGGGGGEDRLTESMSLGFEKVVLTYTTQKIDGTAGGDVVGGWDIKQNRKA